MASQWGRQGKPVAGLAPNFCIDEQPKTRCGCLRQKPQCGSCITNGKPKPSPKPHPYTKLHLFLKFLLLFPLLHLLFAAFPANVTFQAEATHLWCLWVCELHSWKETEVRAAQTGSGTLGSLCSPFTKVQQKGAWQEMLPFCYCFFNCSFSPSISARPCPGTPIVSFVLSSIKKGRRCPIKSKMVDTVIFHSAILGLCVLLLRYTGDWHSVLLKNCC